LAARYRRRDTAEDLPDRGTRLAEDATETVTAGRNAGRATAETITRRDGATELPINDYNTLTARTHGWGPGRYAANAAWVSCAVIAFNIAPRRRYRRRPDTCPLGDAAHQDHQHPRPDRCHRSPTHPAPTNPLAMVNELEAAVVHRDRGHRPPLRPDHPAPEAQPKDHSGQTDLGRQTRHGLMPHRSFPDRTSMPRHRTRWIRAQRHRIVHDPHLRELVTVVGVAHDHRPQPVQIGPDELLSVLHVLVPR